MFAQPEDLDDSAFRHDRQEDLDNKSASTGKIEIKFDPSQEFFGDEPFCKPALEFPHQKEKVGIKRRSLRNSKPVLGILKLEKLEHSKTDDAKEESDFADNNDARMSPPLQENPSDDLEKRERRSLKKPKGSRKRNALKFCLTCKSCKTVSPSTSSTESG